MATYLITDIHGCVHTFRELLWRGIELKKTDTLFLLGDYIDKGPDSKGVLDEIIDLKEKGYQVTALRGNHDQMLLDTLAGKDLKSWKHDLEKQLTLQSFGVPKPGQVPQRYFDLILRMPYYHVLPNYYLVHAGFDFSGKRPLDDTYAMMNTTEGGSPKVAGKALKNRINPEILGGRGLIHGHKATSLQEVRRQLHEQTASQNLDAGCVYYKNFDEGMGHLVALNLETRHLHIQPNIDQPYDIPRKK